EIMLTPNVEGTWSIKDTIAHLSAWMKRLLKWFKDIEAHQSPEIPEKGYKWKDVDELNDAQWARDKDRSLDDGLHDFHDTYHKIYRLLEELSEEDIFESTFDGLITQAMWELVISDTYEHFYEHIVPIREWLAQNQ